MPAEAVTRRRLSLVAVLLAAFLVLPACEMLQRPTDGTFVNPDGLIPLAGALTPGLHGYLPPETNVLYVSPTGNDSNPGTQAKPLLTIQAAADRSIDGTTIVLLAGTYNQTARIQKARVTIQSYPGHAVWLDGSVKLSNWVKDGATWRADGFTSGLAVPTGLGWDILDPNYPLAADPNMAFFNDVSLTQVASKAAVVPGTFYYDAAGAKLYIGDNPAGAEVRATNRADALIVEKAGTLIRGFGVRRYGTFMSDQSATRIRAANVTVDNMAFTQNAAAGISVMSATDVLLHHVSAYQNGRLGIHADNAHRLRVEGSEMHTNNTEHFSTGGAAGGLKTTYSQDVVVTGSSSHHNIGKGIWFDLSSERSTTVRSVVSYNQSGIMVEMSIGGLVASNIVSDNWDHGVYILETSGASVWNNTIFNNNRAISYIDGVRPPVPTSLVVRNNALCGYSDSPSPMMLVDDANGKRSGTVMGVSSDYNAFYRLSPGNTPYVMSWGNYPNGKLVLRTMDEVRSLTKQELTSVSSDNAQTCPFFGEHHTVPTPVIMGAVLPPDVAAAVGWTPGQAPIGMLSVG